MSKNVSILSCFILCPLINIRFLFIKTSNSDRSCNGGLAHPGPSRDLLYPISKKNRLGPSSGHSAKPIALGPGQRFGRSPPAASWAGHRIVPDKALLWLTLADRLAGMSRRFPIRNWKFGEPAPILVSFYSVTGCGLFYKRPA